MATVTFTAPMPDPFRKADGSLMSNEEWFAQRNDLLDFIVGHEYGGMPPKPEVVRIQKINMGGWGTTPVWYKVTAGSAQRQLTFLLALHLPAVSEEILASGKKFPVLLTGDMCYTNLESDTIAEAHRRGYIVACFNRLELAIDCKTPREGGLYDVYPDHKSFTAISAWAWGYMACMDVFMQLPYVDETEVGITGHSRGGKTVMLAAAVDTRIRYCCPNNSGCHGAVSYRTVVTQQGEDAINSERLSVMLDAFPHWMGEKLTPYRDREHELPYDMHYFGALIAPRYYLQCEGQQDYWINPMGSWQNLMAVKACFKRLGCEDHAAGWFRPGYHRHKLPDFIQFMDFMDRARAGLPLSEHLKINPYPEMEKNFSWGE